MFKRLVYKKILDRLIEPRKFITVLTGPRQVGKTTISQQLIQDLSLSTHYASADDPTLQDSQWIEQQWEIARIKCKEQTNKEGLLILDEIQKVSEWSNTVKHLWDEDTSKGISLKVLLLGSSPLLLQHGLTETLAGRFEVIPISHWSFFELREAFGWNLDQYIYFGGYPGAATLINDEERWSNYIKQSLIETTISRDVLLMSRVHKPALLRRLFELGCHYSGQILSYQKMLGQLQDAGNTTTLAHYLQLLSFAGLLTGLQKFSNRSVQGRSSSPKLQVLNTALITAQNTHTFKSAREDPKFWGRLVESAIGAYLYNSTIGSKITLTYWREGSKEIDFIISSGKRIVPIEVKSTSKRTSISGLKTFELYFPTYKKFLVGGQGIPLEAFFLEPIETWLE